MSFLWVLSVIGLIISAGCAYVNTRIMFFPPDQSAGGQRSSCIPFAGGIVGAIALLACPLQEAGHWFWIPFVVDPGSGVYTAMLVSALWRARKEKAAEAPPDSQERVAVERLRSALTGCLLGGAVGDALGLPYEGISRVRGVKLFPAVERYHFLGNRGFCSDDTEHSCMVAQALLETVAYTPAFRAEAFSRNLAWKLRFWLLALPAGIGMATLKSILRLWIGFSAGTSGVRSAGSGPAMRSAVIGVYCAGDTELMRSLVLASTRLTHRDPRAEEGALAVALAAACAAAEQSGNPPEHFIQSLGKFLKNSEESELVALILRAADSARQGEDTAAFADAIGCGAGVSGYMPHTVAVALHAWFRYPKDVRSALTAVVRCGGDTDTVAAITGGIAGAGVGKEGIPEEWLQNLREWPCSKIWMEKLAGCLAETRTGNVRLPPKINPLALLLRNIFFLCVVLGHGVRRMLPPY